jgi:predicted NBD/HSP70 family sugar kinase
MEALWGIDQGGTKIEGIVLIPADPPEVLSRIRIPTQADKGYRHILSRINELVEMLKKDSGLIPEKIGFGTPGSIDIRDGSMKNCNTTCLIGKDLHGDLEKLLNVQVRIENDANCFALAETWFGAAKDYDPEVVFGIIMGTGVGGGLVINKRILTGHHHLGGEWGHNFLDESGGLCYCGKTGCVETVISGPAVEKYYKELSGEKKLLPDISELAEKGNKYASQAIERLVEYFGKALAFVVNIADPDVIIVGGGVGNIERLYTDGVEELKEHVFNPYFEAKVVPPKLGDSAGVFGAAMLFEN